VKWVWVDAGNDADWQKHLRHLIDGEFYAGAGPNDGPAVVASRLEASRLRGHVGGVYTAWAWEPDTETDGAAYAEYTHEIVAKIEERLPVKGNRYPKVQLNNERHEPDIILAMLRRWRELRPTKDTSWTMEGGQGGWMGSVVSTTTPASSFVTEVLSYRVRLVPQLYNGAMTQVWDSLAFARDLTKRGFPDAVISPFYDAAHLPVGWDGFAFTMGRLP
jgi:hypothetical protein